MSGVCLWLIKCCEDPHRREADRRLLEALTKRGLSSDGWIALERDEVLRASRLWRAGVLDWEMGPGVIWVRLLH